MDSIKVTYVCHRTISSDMVADQIHTALYGAGSKWIGNVVRDTKPTIECTYLQEWVCNGGSLKIQTVEPNTDDEFFTLDADAIKRGCQIMADKHPRHFEDMEHQFGDTITADVFLQCCLFGDVNYG